MPEAVKEARIHGTLAGSVRAEWPRANGLGKSRLRRELSRVEETKQSHATTLPQVDQVPDIEGDASQLQPADGHRAVLSDRDACVGELTEQILSQIDLVP
jgi:hypothetical protein